MPDRRLDPKRERWINAGFVLLTIVVAVALFIVAARIGLEQNETGGDTGSASTPQQSRSAETPTS